MPPRRANPALERERDNVLKEIASAFRGVSRDGGISWSEADVIDDYGSMEERQRARAADTERDWTELLKHPDWAGAWLGTRFCFLDAIGFRYYLAPAMVRTLNGGEDSGIMFHLTVPPASDTAKRDYALSQLSALNEPQRACVARFIRYMAAASAHAGRRDEAADWQRALASHWE